jgi:hypothetical protein
LDDVHLTDENADQVVEFAASLVDGICRGRGRYRVPTYYGEAYGEAVADGMLPEFGKPFAPMLVRQADGLRIVLGSYDYDERTAPDIKIERRPNGWMILLHPAGDGDPSGYVCFLTDGRSYVVPEGGATPPVEVREWEAVLA